MYNRFCVYVDRNEYAVLMGIFKITKRQINCDKQLNVFLSEKLPHSSSSIPLQ